MDRNVGRSDRVEAHGMRLDRRLRGGLRSSRGIDNAVDWPRFEVRERYHLCGCTGFDASEREADASIVFSVAIRTAVTGPTPSAIASRAATLTPLAVRRSDAFVPSVQNERRRLSTSSTRPASADRFSRISTSSATRRASTMATAVCRENFGRSGSTVIPTSGANHYVLRVTSGRRNAPRVGVGR